MTPDSINRKRVIFATLLSVVLIITVVGFLVTGVHVLRIYRENFRNEAQVLDEDSYVVTRVVDGDTIEVRRGSVTLRVRYIGVDTPETVQPNRPVECFGREASKFNKELVENKKVRLEEDVQAQDSFGRELRYVYVVNNDGQEIMANEALVLHGYAHAASYPPNVKYQELFREREREARDAKNGLWNVCNTSN